MTGRGQVGELVARLSEARGCDGARDALRRTLGDPSLEINSPPGHGTALLATIPCGLKGEVDDYGGGAPAGARS